MESQKGGYSLSELEKMREALGDDFANQYKKIVSDRTNRSPKLEFEVHKPKIIDLIKSHMTGSSPQLMYKTEGWVYHVVLVRTPEELKDKSGKWLKEGKFGPILTTRWMDKWLSVFNLDWTTLNSLDAGADYFIVGYVTQNNVGKKTFYGIRAQGIITMDELIAHSKNSTNDAEATKRALEEYTEYQGEE